VETEEFTVARTNVPAKCGPRGFIPGRSAGSRWAGLGESGDGKFGECYVGPGVLVTVEDNGDDVGWMYFIIQGMCSPDPS
jgi:hypothetical protein